MAGIISFEDLNTVQKFLSNRVDFDYFVEVIKRTYVMPGEHVEHWERFNRNQIGYITSVGDIGRTLLNKVLQDIEERGYNG